MMNRLNQLQFSKLNSAKTIWWIHPTTLLSITSIFIPDLCFLWSHTSAINYVYLEANSDVNVSIWNRQNVIYMTFAIASKHQRYIRERECGIKYKWLRRMCWEYNFIKIPKQMDLFTMWICFQKIETIQFSSVIIAKYVLWIKL